MRQDDGPCVDVRGPLMRRRVASRRRGMRVSARVPGASRRRSVSIPVLRAASTKSDWMARLAQITKLPVIGPITTWRHRGGRSPSGSSPVMTTTGGGMSSTPMRRVIAAGMIGNVLEWYDFAIYGYFAAQIGRQFFPHEDPVAQLLSAFGVLAVGYLIRPIGGVLIGHIGDCFGRRAALTFSVAAMAIPTFLIGLLPGYASIGLLAPIALIVLRIFQGLSVGGEYTSSMVFLVEHAPEGGRGLMGALVGCSTTGGILLGSAVGAAFAGSMSTAALDAWGWRIPFLLGL